MRIGIHHTKGFFSERWISYCEEKGIDYKIVDCFKTDIVEQLSDCDAFFWHFNHKGPRESKFAKQLLYSVAAAGKKVFPDFNTNWHFDDKVGQKYLLEAINAPLVHSYVFYTRREAKEWAAVAEFPKVFKLRNGAGSSNVRLVKSRRKAYMLIRKAFGRGFGQYEGWSNLKERIRKYCLGKTSLWNVVKGVLRLFHKTEYARVTGRERGYIYFQDFIPDNDHDIRVIVIGSKAFAIKRMVRKNDFRASGSGSVLYEKEHFDDKTIRLAFDLSEKIKGQSIAYDFVYINSEPMLVEISYGFLQQVYDPCVGYWDKEMNWHEGFFNPYGWMIEQVLSS